MANHYLRDQIKQRGKTSVLVMLDEKSNKEAMREKMMSCFQRSEHHKVSSEVLGMAGGRGRAYRYFEGTPGLYLENLGAMYGQVDKQGLQQLEELTGDSESLRATAPLHPVRALGSAKKIPTTGEVSWGLTRIGVPELWAKGLSGKGVLVGHLDTGLDGAHPCFQDVVHAFAEFNATGQKIPDAPVQDSALHGTHTAGIIAGRPHLGWNIGTAPGCQLVSGAVIEEGDKVARVLAGVNWAMNFPIRVLSVSVGFPGYFGEYAPLVELIRAKGILPVFAAGNEGPGVSCSPANYPKAIAVGAVDQSDSVDPSSSSERLPRRSDALVPDLVMPGIDIVSANAGEGNLRADSGTSMAAPHLAGLAALLWEACPEATVAQMEAAIYAACSRPESMEEERANRGIPLALKALKSLESRMRRSEAASARIKRAAQSG